MKIFRLYLCIGALIISIGGALASNHFVNQNLVYRYVDLSWPEDNVCERISMKCGTNFQFPCKINWTGPTFRSHNNVATQCGVELTRQTSPAPFLY
jgi:hypothetical protein